MRKVIIGLCLFILIISNGATYYLTKANIKPEKVIVRQEVEIIKYKYKLREADIREKERFLIRIPATKKGVTKDFTLGTVFGFVLKCLL